MLAEINTTEIKIGQEFANYKALCVALGLEAKRSGNARDSQIAEIRRYIDFERLAPSHRIKITDIHSKPILTVKKSKYQQHIIPLILHHISTSRKHELTKSLNDMMMLLGMANPDFRDKYNWLNSADGEGYLVCECKIPVRVALNIFRNYRQKCKKAIESALDSLQRGGVLNWELTHIVDYEAEDKAISRRLTAEEEAVIKEIEAKALVEMGYSSKRDVLFANMMPQYFRFLCDAFSAFLADDDTIIIVRRLYNVYHITVNDTIESELNQSKANEYRLKINEDLCASQFVYCAKVVKKARDIEDSNARCQKENLAHYILCVTNKFIKTHALGTASIMEKLAAKTKSDSPQPVPKDEDYVSATISMWDDILLRPDDNKKKNCETSTFDGDPSPDFEIIDDSDLPF